MDYNWVGDRQLHLAILYSLELHEHFEVEKFPSFSIAACKKDRRAEYNVPNHTVVFNEYYIQTKLTAFSHLFFHELAHSTCKYTNRWERIWANGSFKVDSIVGLEERIADLVAFIWCDIFDRKFNFNEKIGAISSLGKLFENNPTNFKLPWKEVEDAVFSLMKNKSCPKIIMTLKYYKMLIINNELCSIKEGIFNG